jgi:hypothetical protein
MINLQTYIKNTNMILLGILMFIMVDTCGTKSAIKGVRKEVIRLEVKNDSLNKELIKSIELEGLKSEKRMIQSTDRKIMDVNRMSEIDKEIKQMTK